MDYSAQEVMQYAREADVKMIRLAFCDVFGRQKNIVITPRELERAFGYGIAIDGSAIAGFGGAVRSDLMLRPEPATLSLLPWRPETGKQESRSTASTSATTAATSWLSTACR